MTTKRWILIGGAAALALGGLGAGRALAEWHGHHGFFKKMIEQRVDTVLDKIDATPAQRSAAHADVATVEAAFESFHHEQKAINQELLEEFAKPAMDSAHLATLDQERIDATRALQSQIEAAVVDLHDKLTPEQRTAVLTIIREHEADEAREHEGDHEGEEGAPLPPIPNRANPR